MKKHAFLVIAHHQFDILMTTIKILDDVNNHFYIHIDSKTDNVPIAEINKCANYSKIEFINNMSVNWGGYSQIECELSLLKSSIDGEYDYYHLISGVDLPIKSKDYIFDFFETHGNYEYVHFERPKIQEEYLERIKFFYPFQEMAKRNKVCYYLGRTFKEIQRIIGINRIKKINEELQFGANWFSITHPFALYIIKREEWIYDVFRLSCCADELFVQSLLVNSEFKKNLSPNAFSGEYKNCLRHVDWKRGNPYCFRSEDFKELMNSECLFARKFDLNTDYKIIQLIYNHLKK